METEKVYAICKNISHAGGEYPKVCVNLQTDVR